ncbi:MAG: class I SAM-dependent methyltransferase [Nocardioides sp.]
MTIAETINSLFTGGLPFQLSAYDGSTAGGSAVGPDGAELGLELANERGLSYILSAPGDLGLARAYVSGDLIMHGVHPGDPYPLLKLIVGNTDFARPSPVDMVRLVRNLGLRNFIPPQPPPEEHLPFWRSKLEGLRRHSPERDADAIAHHYDVSNTFYEYVLGPSMTYTCAVFPTEDATLEEAQFAKYDLICKKVGLEPGMRLLDVGCGWGGMVRHAAQHYGVEVLGVTLSAEQAGWGQQRVKEMGLDHIAEVRHCDYRDVAESDFDAVSSIGLTEHIGVKNYRAYFGSLAAKVKPGGRILNHCITRNSNLGKATAGSFIDRYVFPDGELAGSGTLITAAENVGLEVQHHENFRVHYAKTLAGWCRNLAQHWDACVADAGLGTAKVWGLYMAGSRIGFETNEIQLHHVLATKTVDGNSHYPLRHRF